MSIKLENNLSETEFNDLKEFLKKYYHHVAVAKQSLLDPEVQNINDSIQKLVIARINVIASPISEQSSIKEDQST